MKFFFPLLALIALSLPLCSQQITAGPVVGGVSPSSARVYIRLDTAANVTIEWDSSAGFNNPGSMQALIDESNFFGHTFDLPGLSPATRYYYRFRINGGTDTLNASFRSFPDSGTSEVIRLAVGSCNYEPGPDLFQDIVDFDPHLVIHLGDWLYPPSQLGANFMTDSALAAESFSIRYNDEMFRDFILRRFPVDYIYDDDYGYNDSEGWSHPQFSVSLDSNGAAITNFWTIPIDSGIREGAIQSYVNHFPGYPLIDPTAGIHHKIDIAGTDIYMLDCRNNRWPRHEAFIYDSATGLWAYEPPPGHTMLGERQRNWLYDELRNGQADWKIIGSTIIFNKAYQRLLDLGIQYQKIASVQQGSQQSGAVLASQMAYNWVGYPEDHDTILAMAASGELKDVVVVSGDTHSDGLDDGRNAGLPEMNSSGWAAGDEAILYQVMDDYLRIFGQGSVKGNIWSHGASGVDGNSTLDAWGTVEIFGRDSLRMCMYDRMGANMGCLTLKHSSLPTDIPEIENSVKGVSVFPNPTTDFIQIQMEGDHPIIGSTLRIRTLIGEVVWESSAMSRQSVSTLDWAKGTYLLSAETIDGEKFIEKILLQ